MKITPLEIKQKKFEKKLRGYDREEVQAYLLSLSNQWERLLDENKKLIMKLEISEKELKRLREVESSLFKTLKTAEETSSTMIDNTAKEVSLQLKETQMQSNKIVAEAKDQAEKILQDSRMKSRKVLSSLNEEIKKIELSYKQLENYRLNTISELMNLSNDLKERAERNRDVKKIHFDNYKFDDLLELGRTFKEENELSSLPEENQKVTSKIKSIDDAREEEKKTLSQDSGKSSPSFFDNLK